MYLKDDLTNSTVIVNKLILDFISKDIMLTRDKTRDYSI